MRVVYLLESAAHLWGGVKIALEGANMLVDRGHDVLVISKTEAPTWMPVRFRFQTVTEFTPEVIPPSDVIVATDWITVPAAAGAFDQGRGQLVHLVQGYDGSYEQKRGLWEHIDRVFGHPAIPKIAISKHLVHTMRERFGVECHYVPNMIDQTVMFPDPVQRPVNRPVRVGLVGPYMIDWKDIATGYAACRIAAECGLQLELVRISNARPTPAENLQPFPVEWHVGVQPHEMGDLYRSMDVFLGTSQGVEEGFFLPAVEAMACGTPCVLTDIPCFREYGDDQHALFVPPKDPMEMAQALVLVAGREDLRTPLRRIGLETAATYSPKAHGDALESALTTIAATRATA